MLCSLTYVLLFIFIDICVGTIKSLRNKTWKSSIFRNGLYKKFSEVSIISLCILIDKYFIDVVGASTNLYSASCTYVIIMEILSTLENFSKNGELSGFIDMITGVLHKKEGDKDK